MSQETPNRVKFRVGNEMRWLVEKEGVKVVNGMIIRLIDDSRGVHVVTMTTPKRMRRLLLPEGWTNHESGTIELPNSFFVDEGWRVLEEDLKTVEVKRVTLSTDEL
ncbi:MAG: hypothetical protein WCT01_05110 [Candidatus Shapirobacteria bacterium]